VAGCCEHGNEPSGSIRGGEFLDSLSEMDCSMELISSLFARTLIPVSHVLRCPYTFPFIWGLYLYLYQFQCPSVLPTQTVAQLHFTFRMLQQFGIFLINRTDRQTDRRTPQKIRTCADSAKEGTSFGS